MTARDPGEEACGVEEDGIDDDEDNVGYAIAVEIFGSKVESAWVHINHCDDVDSEGWADRRPGLQVLLLYLYALIDGCKFEE